MALSYRQKSFLLRLCFLLTIAAAVYFYSAGLTDYTILLALVLFAGSFFFITETVVTQKTVVVRRGYCWALMPFKWTITYPQIYDVQTSVFNTDPTYTDPPIASSELGCLFSFLGIFFTVNWKNYTIKYEQNHEHKQVVVKLTNDQYIDIWRRTKDWPSQNPPRSDD